VSAWLVAGGAAVAVTVALSVVVWRGSALAPASPASPAAADVGEAGAPPDISAMSPKERFDRLYGRVMRALQSGDGTTLARFAPMALAAYDMIDSADVDSATRRRATLLRLHLGDTTVARTLGGPRAPPLPASASTGKR